MHNILGDYVTVIYCLKKKNTLISTVVDYYAHGGYFNGQNFIFNAFGKYNFSRTKVIVGKGVSF